MTRITSPDTILAKEIIDHIQAGIEEFRDIATDL